MARADQFKALLRAYAGDEESQFLSVALQVAAEEAQRCRRRLNFEPPCRSNIEPGLVADRSMVGCG
jgi:hypothetical protein